MKKFVWKNIVTRFGEPDSLISDNGLQFEVYEPFAAISALRTNILLQRTIKAMTKLRQ